MIPIVCISDLHLGEPYSLFSDPARSHDVANTIGRMAQGRIGRLVLLGDTHEQAIPTSADSPSQVARQFFGALTTDPQYGCVIDEIIWLPGNHDHSLWTDYVKGARGSDSGVALGTGEILWEHGTAANPAADHLMQWGIGAAALRRINRVRAFNPYYVEVIGGNALVFHHGHYFDSLLQGRSALVGAGPLSGVVARAQLASNATTIAQMEAQMAPLIDSLYGFQGGGQSGRSQFWEILLRAIERFGTNEDCAAAKAGAAPAIGSVSEPQGAPDEMVNHAVPFLRKFVLPSLDAGANVKLIHGHTHDGGEFDLNVDGRNVRCHNTGGWVTWVTENGKIIPHSHVLTVDVNGTVKQSAIQFQPDAIAASIRRGRAARAMDVGPVGGLNADGPSSARNDVFD